MESHRFKRRPGTTDRGHDFANYFIANLMLKLITDDSVEDFFLSSDDKDYGSFDDVVVEIVYRSGHRQIYAIQLKHLEERNLTVASLESGKGKFSIKNYFENFKFPNECPAAILYTNAPSPDLNRQVLNLKNLGRTNIWETSLESVLTTSKNGKIYCLGTENSGTEDFRNFCKKFFLYTNQANVTQLEKQTRDLFEERFGCKGSSFIEYVNFIIKWCEKKGEIEALNKTWIRNVIAICILKPFVQPLSFSSRRINENTKVLREAISLFQTTVFNSGCYETVRELWSDFKPELTDQVKSLNVKYSVTSDFIEFVDDPDGREKETSIMLWLLDKCPLILAEAPEVYRAIEVFQEKKFIILNPKKMLQSKSVFQKLSDLEINAAVYENILATFTCSFQGKQEVTLKNFFHGCQGVGEILTTNQLLQMVDGPLIIGEGMEVLPASHVPRRISKNVINIKCLEKLKQDTLIVIDNRPNTTSLKKDGEFYVTTIKEFLKTKSGKENKVYLCKGKCLRADVEELRRKTNKVEFYHFRHLNETLLEYISSSNIDEIKYFIKKEHFDRECELYQNDNDINIICANPGMGKTTLMKNLKNNIPSSLWTVLIYARNYSSYFKKKKTNILDFLNYFIENKKNFNIFYQNVIQLLLSQRRIVILWDGLDEMADENLEVVKKLIHDAKVQGYKQWVTSRNHLKSTLEDEFNTLSSSLEEFDEKEQKKYIGERLNLNGNEVDDIFTKIQKNIALFPNNNILGIPLQSFMLTELFLQDRKKYLGKLNEIFSLADLYEHFVDEKFSVYYREKENLVDTNDYLQDRNERDKKLMVNSYEVAAIHTYFDKEVASQLLICSQNLSLRSKKDPIGFIVNTTNDSLSEFCHNSFGEYFAASYLAKNHSNFFVTFDLLFKSKYDNIRLFYDLILAKGCKGHISVLYRNYELLTTCTDDEICKTDKFGRSTLEVACSWRKIYPLLQVTEYKLGNFVFERKLSIKNEMSNLQKIILFLVTHLTPNPNKYDLILNKGLLLPFVLLKKDDIDYLKMENNHYYISVLIYAVALDFGTIFDFFENIPYIHYMDMGDLLGIALQIKSVNCLKRLAFHQTYDSCISNTYVLYAILSIFQSNSLFDEMKDLIKDINVNISSDSEQYTLLHYACGYNNYEVASWLLKNGASINLTNKFGDLPLHVACRSGNYDIVKLLINEGSKFMEANNLSMVPLECAIDANSIEIVAYLLEREALVNHKNGKIFLHRACRKGFIPIAELLLQKNANVNAKDNLGNTPLHLACESYQLFKILIDNGADPFALNNNKQSVIHLTSNSKVLNLLLESGLSLNTQDRQGKMLIHYVCSNERDYPADFFDILIQNASDVNAIDKDHESICKSLTLNYDTCSKWKKSLENGEATEVSDSTIEASTSEKSELYIKKKDFNGRTPLHYACLSRKKCSLELIKCLLKNGSNPNLTDNNNKTPLHYACTSKWENICEIVSVLITAGVSVDIPDAHGKLPLHYACISGQFPIVKLLVDHRSIINFLDENGMTPLQYAYDYKFPLILNLLFENGAKIDYPNAEGKTPIHYACMFGRLEDVKLYLEKGVDVNVLDKQRKSPLHYACISGQFPIVKLLVDHRSIINFLDENGMTPLQYAYDYKFPSILNLLFENGAKIDYPNAEGKTPIHYACMFGRLEDVKLYLEKGVDVNVLDKQRKSPLHYACGNNRSDIVNLLTANGANGNIKDVKGKTPLFYANLEILRFLILNTPADVNAVDNHGLTLLHYSAKNGDYECVKLLTENGAKINVADNAGRFPIHLARSRRFFNSDEIIKLLTDDR